LNQWHRGEIEIDVRIDGHGWKHLGSHFHNDPERATSASPQREKQVRILTSIRYEVIASGSYDLEFKLIR
jgi:hypothetical protein